MERAEGTSRRAAGRAWLRKHRRYLVFAGAGAAAILVAAGALAWFGEELPRARRGRAIGALVCAAGVWVLASAVYFAARSARPKIAVPLAALVVWLAFETWAPPHLRGLVPLPNYKIIRDVDHVTWHVTPDQNSDHVRGAPEAEEFRPEDVNLLFLGDSFTYGEKLAYADCFPARVGELLAERYPERRLRVANLAWSSSSPLLSWRRLSDIGERYFPDLVVLAIDMTDFADDIRYQNMLDRRGMYALYERLPLTLKIFRSLSSELYEGMLLASVGNPPRSRFFVTEAPLEETRAWIEPLRRNVERIHSWCRERNVDFVLAVLPRSYQYSHREAPDNWEKDEYTVFGPYCLEPFRYFDELRDEVDYPIVSLLEAFRTTEVFPTCFPDDPHWNPAGALVAARSLAPALALVLDARLETER